MLKIISMKNKSFLLVIQDSPNWKNKNLEKEYSLEIQTLSLITKEFLESFAQILKSIKKVELNYPDSSLDINFCL